MSIVPLLYYPPPRQAFTVGHLSIFVVETRPLRECLVSNFYACLLVLFATV